MSNNSEKPVIQSVERALEILNLLSEYPELSITKIGEKMHLSKSTVYGLVSTLCKHGYVSQNPDTLKYYLGVKFFELSSRAQARMDFREVALPFMRTIQKKYGTTVNLVVLNNADVVYIECLQSYSILSVKFNVGTRLPANCTASGKCLLSELSETELDALYEKYPIQCLTSNSVCDLESLKKQLRCIRENGYAFDNEESSLGVTGIAVNLLNSRGEAVAALSLGGPISQFPNEMKTELCNMLKNVAAEISKGMGCQTEF